MASFGVIQQGNFTATGNAVNLNIRSDVDWMRVYNITNATADQTTALGTEFYWQRGFPAAAGITYYKSSAANAANLEKYLTTNGFTLINTTANPLGTLNSTITAISTASIPVATNSGTNGLVAGQVVRLYSVVGAPQLSGMDFTVGYNTLSTTTFSLDYMSQLSVAGTTASWRVVNWDLPYYPRFRYITKITSSGSSSIITLSVTHGYTVGQKVQFSVPTTYGMTQMNGLEGTITAINTTTTSGNTLTVDIDSSTFTAFAFPLAANANTARAVIVPVGDNSAYSISQGVDILADAVYNTSFIGMQLAGGAGNPGGAANDVVYWVAGKSFKVNNTIAGTF